MFKYKKGSKNTFSLLDDDINFFICQLYFRLPHPTSNYYLFHFRKQHSCLFILLWQSIVFSLRRFFSFESISLIVIFIHFLFIVLIYLLSCKTTLKAINLRKPSGDYPDLFLKILKKLLFG